MIIRLELQILAAVVLDMVIGDPWGFPHPVRGIGWALEKLEGISRRLFDNPRKAGVLTWFLVSGGTAAVTLFLLRGAYLIHPIAGDCLSILIIYTTVASRDLVRHALYVKDGLAESSLDTARTRLSMIVSRETAGLSKAEIVSTTVESAAENISDGIVAPLFFAFLGGPAAAMTYKAVSTMDSMVGYKNERYLRFGWFPARMDDLLNYLPARISAVFLLCAAALTRRDGKGARRILRRDRKKSSSPNAGWPESVVAGALGIQFGGKVRYFGKTVDKPYIGDNSAEPAPEHIGGVVSMLLVTLMLTLFTGAAIRFGISLLLR